MGGLPDIAADHIGLHPGNQFPDTAASICDQVFRQYSEMEWTIRAIV